MNDGAGKAAHGGEAFGLHHFREVMLVEVAQPMADDLHQSGDQTGGVRAVPAFRRGGRKWRLSGGQRWRLRSGEVFDNGHFAEEIWPRPSCDNTWR